MLSMKTFVVVGLLTVSTGAALVPQAGATQTMTCLSTWTWTFTPPLAAVSGQGTVVIKGANHCLITNGSCGVPVCPTQLYYEDTATGVYGGTCMLASVVALGGAFQIVGAAFPMAAAAAPYLPFFL